MNHGYLTASALVVSLIINNNNAHNNKIYNIPIRAAMYDVRCCILAIIIILHDIIITRPAPDELLYTYKGTFIPHNELIKYLQCYCTIINIIILRRVIVHIYIYTSIL